MANLEKKTTTSSGERQALAAELRKALQADKRVHAWTMRTMRTRSHELYLAREEIDARRVVETESVRATVLTKDGTRMGSADLRLGPGEGAFAAERIEQALRLAATGAMEPYELAPKAALPAVALSDPALGSSPRQTLDALRDQLRSIVAGEPDVSLAGAEFFLHEDDERFETSTGVTADRSGTRTAAELVLLGQGPDRSEGEVQALRYRRTVDDLDFEPWLRILAQWARDAAIAQPPPTWTGPVLLPGDVLSAFLQPVVEQASEGAVYQKGPHLTLNEPVHRGSMRGAGIGLSSDATVRYGTASYVCDLDGVPGQSVQLIENGVLRRRWAERRYAEYAGTAATGSFGTLVIEPGQRTERDLRDEGNVLEVMQFSWLIPNRTTGDFTSEVRFGYLSRGMARIPVHGGLLSGNVFEALGGASFSTQQRFYGDSYVPTTMRVDNLSYSGH